MLFLEKNFESNQQVIEKKQFRSAKLEKKAHTLTILPCVSEVSSDVFIAFAHPCLLLQKLVKVLGQFL